MKDLSKKAKAIVSIILMITIIMTCFCSCKKKTVEEETTVKTEETTIKEEETTIKEEVPINDCITGVTILSVEEFENLLTEEQKACTYNGYSAL